MGKTIAYGNKYNESARKASRGGKPRTGRRSHPQNVIRVSQKNKKNAKTKSGYERRMCTSKRAYASEFDAISAAVRASARSMQPLRYYQCPTAKSGTSPAKSWPARGACFQPYAQ